MLRHFSRPDRLRLQLQSLPSPRLQSFAKMIGLRSLIAGTHEGIHQPLVRPDPARIQAALPWFAFRGKLEYHSPLGPLGIDRLMPGIDTQGYHRLYSSSAGPGSDKFSARIALHKDLVNAWWPTVAPDVDGKFLIALTRYDLNFYRNIAGASCDAHSCYRLVSLSFDPTTTQWSEPESVTSQYFGPGGIARGPMIWRPDTTQYPAIGSFQAIRLN